MSFGWVDAAPGQLPHKGHLCRVFTSGAKLICDESVNLPDQFNLYMTHDGSLGRRMADPGSAQESRIVQVIVLGRCGGFLDGWRIGCYREKPLLEFGSRHRMSEIIPLALVAPHFNQDGSCLGILDPFGDDLETELLAETDRGANDGGVISLDAQLRDEGAVDFQGIIGNFLRWVRLA